MKKVMGDKKDKKWYLVVIESASFVMRVIRCSRKLVCPQRGAAHPQKSVS
jgi:hypothetical protein